MLSSTQRQYSKAIIFCHVSITFYGAVYTYMYMFVHIYAIFVNTISDELVRPSTDGLHQIDLMFFDCKMQSFLIPTNLLDFFEKYFFRTCLSESDHVFMYVRTYICREREISLA